MSEILAAWPAMIVGFASGFAAGVVLLLAMRLMLKPAPPPPIRKRRVKPDSGVVRLGSAATDSLARARAAAEPEISSDALDESAAPPTWDDITPAEG